MPYWIIATRQYAIIAMLICIRTAFSVVFQKFFFLRCCLRHLKKNSINYLFLIEIGAIQCRKLLRIRQKDELTVIFFIVISGRVKITPNISSRRDIWSVSLSYLSLYSLAFFASICLSYTLI